MADDDKNKPNPIEDVRKGLGLLFRAARTTLEHLPSTSIGGKLEDVVMSGAKEVGRAIENVANAVEREVTKRAGDAKSDDAKDATTDTNANVDATNADAKKDESTTPDAPPKP